MSTAPPVAAGANRPTDTVTLELISGALQAARAEMEALIDRTSMSPFIREKKDYFTAFLDADGRLAVSTSLTLAGNLVEGILEHYPRDTMRDGDLYLYNDPYASRGGVSHLPDMVFVAPVFHGGEMLGYAEAWGHLWDVGGSVPGSISPGARSTFEEGIQIPPVRVMREGVLNEEVWRIFTRNSRFPDMLSGDVKAIMAACRLGKRRLEEVAARFGAAALRDAFAFVQARSEASLRQALARRVPDGSHAFRDWIDSDAVSDQSYSVHVRVTKSGDEVTLDFGATDDQAEGPINFVMDQSVPKYMLGLYLGMDDPQARMNAGFERAIGAVRTRPGSLVAPHFPASLGLRSHTMIRVTGALLGALARATGGDASAASSVYVLYYLRSHDRRTGIFHLCIEGLSVGFGARTYADGLDAVYYVAQKNYPVEFAEMEFGVRIEALRIHTDSGGPGRHRGGCGIVRDVRVLADSATLGLRLDNCRHPAFGVNGGMSGRGGRVIVNPDSPDARTLPTMSDGHALREGDLLRIVTPGGGGWGSPLERPAEVVLGDVLDGFVSVASARDDYGVVLDASGTTVDHEATSRLRAELAKVPRTMFHRGRYLTDEEVTA
ncbi:MAG: hydantoinase B/oxoprolinase family protein [Ectothiorhodospiraceae bacterium]|nr:hydantoinase B/oxoprolinase family protein [Ectothiorhodospiraceae bacterium]